MPHLYIALIKASQFTMWKVQLALESRQVRVTLVFGSMCLLNSRTITKYFPKNASRTLNVQH